MRCLKVASIIGVASGYSYTDVCFGMDQSACSKAEGCKFYGKAYNGKGGCVTVGGPNDPKANPHQDVCFGMNQSDCSKAEGCKFYGKAYGGKGGCVTVGGPNDPKASGNAAKNKQVRADRQFAERLQKKENSWSFNPRQDVCFGMNQSDCSKAEGCKFYGKAYDGKGGCVKVGGPNDPKASKDAAQKAQVRSDRQFAERLQKKEKSWSFSAGVQFGSKQDKCKGMEQSDCSKTPGCKYYGKRVYNGQGGCVTVGGPNDPDATAGNRLDACKGMEQSDCSKTPGCKYYGKRAYNGQGGCVTVGGPNDPDATAVKALDACAGLDHFDCSDTPDCVYYYDRCVNYNQLTAEEIAAYRAEQAAAAAEFWSSILSFFKWIGNGIVSFFKWVFRGFKKAKPSSRKLKKKSGRGRRP